MITIGFAQHSSNITERNWVFILDHKNKEVLYTKDFQSQAYDYLTEDYKKRHYSKIVNGETSVDYSSYYLINWID